jgi:hypothetical protein
MSTPERLYLLPMVSLRTKNCLLPSDAFIACIEEIYLFTRFGCKDLYFMSYAWNGRRGCSVVLVNDLCEGKISRVN